MINYREAFEALLRDVLAYDATLDDAENEGRNAQAPTGDDYNELYETVLEHARKAGLPVDNRQEVLDDYREECKADAQRTGE